MSSGWFVASYVALWAVLILVLIGLLALLRQIGVLHQRLGPRSALLLEDVPPVGSRLPELRIPALDGSTLAVPNGDPLTLAVVVQPDCSVCEELAPAVATLMRDPPSELAVVALVSDPSVEKVKSFAEKYHLPAPSVAVVPDIGSQLGIDTTPMAVVADGEGLVLSSGIANSLEELEVLIDRARNAVLDGDEVITSRAVAISGDSEAVPMASDGRGEVRS